MGIYGYDNEFQAAFDVACTQYVSRCQDAEATRLAEAGRFPVCTEMVIHCPYTDAYMASEVYIVETFNTLPEAMAYVEENGGEWDGEGGLYIKAAGDSAAQVADKALGVDVPEDGIPF